jgi:hypothetical protein
VTMFVGQAGGPAGGLKRQRASEMAGFATAAIAAMALIGWWAGLPLLSSWVSGFATMKPVTALCLIVLGLALMHPGKDWRFAFAVGLVVAVVALLDLGEDLFGTELGIGPLQMSRTAAPAQSAASFSMAHATALGLALAGGSLALSRFERHRFAATGQALRATEVPRMAVPNKLTRISDWRMTEVPSSPRTEYRDNTKAV